METLGFFKGIYRVILGYILDYIGILDKKKGIYYNGVVQGSGFGDNGKENGSYYLGIRGLGG